MAQREPHGAWSSELRLMAVDIEGYSCALDAASQLEHEIALEAMPAPRAAKLRQRLRMLRQDRRDVLTAPVWKRPYSKRSHPGGASIRVNLTGLMERDLRGG